MMKSIILASSLAAMSMGVQAGDFYVLGDVGQSKAEISVADYTVSFTETLFDIGAGYNLNETIAFEFAYRDLGGSSSSDEYYASASDLTSLQLSALGKLPVNDAMFVFGRLGVARLSLDESETFKSPQGDTYESSSESKTKALVGLGAGYNVSQALTLRAEYLRHAKVGEVTFSSLSLGATYSF